MFYVFHDPQSSTKTKEYYLLWIVFEYLQLNEKNEGKTETKEKWHNEIKHNEREKQSNDNTDDRRKWWKVNKIKLQNQITTITNCCNLQNTLDRWFSHSWIPRSFRFLELLKTCRLLLFNFDTFSITKAALLESENWKRNSSKPSERSQVNDDRLWNKRTRY